MVNRVCASATKVNQIKYTRCDKMQMRGSSEEQHRRFTLLSWAVLCVRLD